MLAVKSKSWFESWVLTPCQNWICVVGQQISYWNFEAVLALPKMAHSAQKHKSISFIWIVWSTLCVYESSQWENIDGSGILYEF